MYYKDFHDMKISALGMGCLRFPMEKNNINSIDRKEATKVIDIAIKSGINYFDTAYTYQDGDGERFLGEILQKYPRDSYYLATKYYEACDISIEDVFEEQLKRCNTNYFDFYLLHGMDENYFSAYTDEKKGYLAYLLKQKELGIIKYLGFSSHASPETLEKFLQYYSDFDMALIQLNYLDWTILDAKRQYGILTKYNIPVWVMEPLKGGRLSELNKESREILQEISPDKSIASWGFRFIMSLENVQTVLSGMSTVEQVLDNAKTFEYNNPLTDEERKTLAHAKEIFLKDLGVPCSACGYCRSTCPAELNIPLLIKAYNEYNVSGELWRVADFNKQKQSPSDCLKCKTCLKDCPQKIDIPQIMDKFSHMLKG